MADWLQTRFWHRTSVLDLDGISRNVQTTATSCSNSLCRFKKGAFYHALLEQVVGPYVSEVDLQTYFPDRSEEDRREHMARAMANSLRAAGLSKDWTDLLRQWFTGGWFLVEGIHNFVYMMLG